QLLDGEDRDEQRHLRVRARDRKVGEPPQHDAHEAEAREHDRVAGDQGGVGQAEREEQDPRDVDERRGAEAERDGPLGQRQELASGSGRVTTPFGTSGSERSRTPLASKIAFAIAGATQTIGVSPAPAEATSLRSSSTTSIFGTSLKRGTR